MVFGCQYMIRPLTSIYNAPRPQKHYYIDFAPNVGNPVFKNELTCPKMDYQDDGLKLLSLYRYCNIIEYFFPYKHLIDRNWDSVLFEFIPKIIGANTELSYKLTLLELIGMVQDTHAGIYGDGVLYEFWGKNFVPLEVKVIENQFLVTRLFEEAKETGIEVGDIITKIKGQDVWSLVDQNLKYTPSSNYTVLAHLEVSAKNLES